MDHRPTLAGAIFGAAIGGAAGYLFFTEAGRRSREEIGEALDRLSVDVHDLGVLWERLRDARDRYREAPADELLADIARLLKGGPRSLGGAA
jgi:gas vesicle protein